MKKDIAELVDIKLMVDEFYGKVRIDPLIGPIFINVIEDNWPNHLDKMYRFWQTVLLKEHAYQGSPFVPHAKLPVQKRHFDRWLKLFNETINEHFEGPVAGEAKWRGERMAEMFQMKIEHYRDNPSQTIL